ncbi:MAG: hypothetical protein JWN70_5072 [Planctomycetaceae bacterium]|nr:hypothetical protein [Planctomycetaceae bacterium]
MKRLNWTRTCLLCSVIVGASLISQIGPGTPSVAWAADEAGSTFSGQVVLDGEIPKLEHATTDADPKAQDLKQCGIKFVPQEKLVVDAKSKGIANVFIYLKKAPADMPAALKKSKSPKVTFDQKGCQFLPHALLVRNDQTVEVLSDDPVGHNTHTYPVRNNPFNSAIKAKERTGVPVTAKVIESLPLQVKCDIHPWMTAWWLVLDHPYAAVTDAQGNFSIADLPPGSHEFVVWQESVGYIERKLVVKVEAKKNPAPVTIKAPIAKFKL